MLPDHSSSQLYSPSSQRKESPSTRNPLSNEIPNDQIETEGTNKDSNLFNSSQIQTLDVAELPDFGHPDAKENTAPNAQTFNGANGEDVMFD